MSTKLYVGNLPFDTNEADLESHFGQAGAVASVSLMRDRRPGARVASRLSKWPAAPRHRRRLRSCTSRPSVGAC